MNPEEPDTNLDNTRHRHRKKVRNNQHEHNVINRERPRQHHKQTVQRIENLGVFNNKTASGTADRVGGLVDGGEEESGEEEEGEEEEDNAKDDLEGDKALEAAALPGFGFLVEKVGTTREKTEREEREKSEEM